MNAPATTQGCSMLVVDDDASLAYTLKRFLEREGYAVEVALSGVEALEIQAQNPRISLAMVDLMMPLTDGITVMEAENRAWPRVVWKKLPG